MLYLQQWGTYSVWNPSRSLMMSKAGVVLLTLVLTVLQTTTLSWLGGHMPALMGPKRVTVNMSPLNKSQHTLLFTPGSLKCSILFSVSYTGRTDSYECTALSRVLFMLLFKSYVCVNVAWLCWVANETQGFFTIWWFELSVTRSFVPLPCKSLSSALEGGRIEIMCVCVCCACLWMEIMLGV